MNATTSLGLIGSGRATDPAEIDGIVAGWRADQYVAGVLHLGDAIDDDIRAAAYATAVAAASAAHAISVTVETHRATVTQDLWRTVQLAARHPELRFDLDFSQSYVAGGLTYGDYAGRLRYAEPVRRRRHGSLVASSRRGCPPVDPHP